MIYAYCKQEPEAEVILRERERLMSNFYLLWNGSQLCEKDKLMLNNLSKEIEYYDNALECNN